MCSRDCKKAGLGAFAVFIVNNFTGWLIHDKALGAVYQKAHYAGLWNSKEVMGSRMGLMLVGYALFAVFFTLIYDRGYEEGKAPLGQGLRYGLLVGLMMHGFHGLMSYFVYPVSLKLAGAWIAFGTLECVLAGVVLALIYRPAPHAH